MSLLESQREKTGTSPLVRKRRNENSQKREVPVHPHLSPTLLRGIGVLLLIAPCATACTGWRVQRLAPESVLVAQQPTRILVTRTDGSRQVLDQPTVVQDTLVGIGSRGTAAPGTPLPAAGERRIALSDVRHVSTRELSPGNTLALLLGLGALAFGGYIALLAIGCGDC
jgi:hypothetical protein